MSRVMPQWLHPAPDSLLACAVRRGRPAWTEWVHLGWTVWVFIVPAFTPQGYDLQWLVLTAVSWPVFVALYAMAILCPPRQVAWAAAGMCLLSLCLLPWYPSGMSYFVFGCVFFGVLRWRRALHYILLLMALCLFYIVLGRMFGYPWSALAWVLATVLVISPVMLVQRTNERMDAALRLSHDEVRRLAATGERERIGRDLHDLLGHTLSLVALKADLAGRLVGNDPQAAQREIAELGQVARDALAQVRHAVTGIRAASLAAEAATARLLLETDGVSMELDMDDAGVPPPHLETVLALCLREAVTNIHRHARANRVHVRLQRDARHWQLHVEDDGRGGGIRAGNGLDGMGERLRALGGSLRVEPAPRRGTLLVAELPCWDAGAHAPQPVARDASTRPV